METNSPLDGLHVYVQASQIHTDIMNIVLAFKYVYLLEAVMFQHLKDMLT